MLKVQFLKFIVVGVLSTIVNYGFFYGFLNYLGMDYLLSSALGFLFGVFAGYLINKRWTFQVKSKNLIHVIKYYLVYSCSLVISIAILKLVVDILGMKPEIANILVIGITTCTNFVGIKWIVFNEKNLRSSRFQK